MHRRNNNVRKQKKAAGSSFGETVRIASLVHKGMKSGRSSYVEMSALARMTNHNVKARIKSIAPLNDPVNEELKTLLSEIPSVVSDGYTRVLNPNGMIRKDVLDELLAMDSEIVIALGTTESHLRAGERIDRALAALREIVKERRELSESLKA